MRQASIAMSCVAEQKARNSAPIATWVMSVAGALPARLSKPKPMPICATSIQLRRLPSQA